MEFLVLIINGIVTSAIMFIISSKIMNINLIKNKGKFIFSYLILCAYFVISYPITMSFVRYFLFLEMLFICFKVLYAKNNIKLWLTAFCCWALLLISEFSVGIILTLLFNIDALQYTASIIINGIISLISYILFIIKPINKFIVNLINKDYNSKTKYNILFLNIMAFSFSVMLYINYIKTPAIVSLNLSLLIIFVYTIVTLKLFEIRETNEIIQIEYENINKNLSEYEQMLDFQRVENHENKNQLLVIKSMVEKNDKGIIKYINSLIEDKFEDNEDFLYKTNKIPAGGLRGLIYYKTLLMKEKNINVEININKSVRKINFSNFNVNVNKDICKIIGVFLDNAIEAVEKLNEKYISITMNIEENDFVISITNNFLGDLDIGVIDEKGYSTKGKGHGYGLSLVKELIDKNQLLTNNRYITSNSFTQKLFLKLNKKS